MEDQYKMIDNQVVDITTGEIIDEKDILKAKKNDLLNRYEDIVHTSIELGQIVDLKIVKKRNGENNQVRIKDKYQFIKMFKGDLKNMILNPDIKLSIYAHGFLNIFTPFLKFPLNVIVVESKNPSIEKIGEMLGVKERKTYDVLKELEYYDIIKRVKCNGCLMIYVNPFLYSSGGLVDYETYKLFEKSIYNPKNRSE